MTKEAASSSQIGRFDTGVLTGKENRAPLTDLQGTGLMPLTRGPTVTVALNMDNSVSETHGDQQSMARYGHFGCIRYHLPFMFNQSGDLERCALRPGNARSVANLHDVPRPVVAATIIPIRVRSFTDFKLSYRARIVQEPAPAGRPWERLAPPRAVAFGHP